MAFTMMNVAHTLPMRITEARTQYLPQDPRLNRIKDDKAWMMQAPQGLKVPFMCGPQYRHQLSEPSPDTIGNACRTVAERDPNV